jgi:hypothetical protein
MKCLTGLTECYCLTGLTEWYCLTGLTEGYCLTGLTEGYLFVCTRLETEKKSSPEGRITFRL